MRNNKLLTATLLATVVLIAIPTAVRSQVTQSEIAKGLTSNDRGEVAMAVAQAQRVGVANLGEEVRQAAMNALRREGTLAAQRRDGLIDPFPNAELLGRLAAMVAAFEDPRAVQPLAGALGNSPLAAHALADFGQAAARAVLDVAEHQEDGSVLMDSFLLLRFLVEKHNSGGRRLSANALDRIRALAVQGLEGRYSDVIMYFAIDLALALDEPILLEMVQQIADDVSVIKERVTTTEAYARRVQEHAAERLSGTPALPECCMSSPFS